MHRMRTCAGLLTAAVLFTGGAAHASTAGEDEGKLKVCVYGLDAGETAVVSVNGGTFGSYPGAGKCETDKVRKGGYTIRTATGGGAILDEAEITDKRGRRNDTSPDVINVSVYNGKTTRVNIFVK